MARTYATHSALIKRDRDWSAAITTLVATAREEKPSRGELFARLEKLVRDMVEDTTDSGSDRG